MTLGKIIDKSSNFIASILCYVCMPLTPFVFEFFYTHPHEIATRSVTIALSTYSFSSAFGTKFRIISVALIFVGFMAGGMYGTVDAKEMVTVLSFPTKMLMTIMAISSLEWLWRHFVENEKCWFYTIFQPK